MGIRRVRLPAMEPQLFLAMLALTFTTAGAGGLPQGDVCRISDPKQGGCKIDGSGCDGEQVVFAPYNLTISKWDETALNYTLLGNIMSHAIVGEADTWQMYLHGPRVREKERQPGDFVPPLYVQATFNNMIYRFENITRDDQGGPLTATQKMVGNAVAPSTSYPIEDAETGRVKGLLVAEGNPFWINSMLHPTHMDIFKGGVDYLDDKNCTRVFPTEPSATPKVAHDGQVVNTVDCHDRLGVCFFSVWKFYDDTKFSREMDTGPDCLWYCIMEKGGLDGRPVCEKTGIVKFPDGSPICSVHGVGAVHGMTVGNTISVEDEDHGEFDALLVFTGGATFDSGESSMKKIRLKVGLDSNGTKEMTTVKSAVFATQLFEDTVGKHNMSSGHDVGGDHAWVDATGKYVWISTFRLANPGLHMVEYETGKLIYSIHGLSDYIKDNYSYTAGIHGSGTLGKPNSVIAVATSACTLPHSACFPVPWLPGVPSSLEARAIFFIVDISQILSMVEGVVDVDQL